MNLSDINNIELLSYIKDYVIEYKDKLSNINIPFGCEIEFENILYDNIKNNIKEQIQFKDWTLSYDPSLDNAYHTYDLMGGELSSPILSDNENTWINIKNICQFLRENGACNTELSGGHIHFDNSLFKDNYVSLLRLVKLWSIYEDIIYRISMNFDTNIRYGIYTYAIPVGIKYKKILNSSYVNDFKTLLSVLKISKNYGLSFFHFSDKDYNTIEFRTPNGSINEVVWQNNINIFMHLLNTCLDNNKDWDYIDYLLKNYNNLEYEIDNLTKLKIDKAKEFGDFIYSCDEYKLDFMKQYIK